MLAGFGERGEIMSALQPATRAAPAPTAIVADDHGELAEMIASQLAADGWRAHAADSGTAAIAAIAELAPELVITDLRMPGADGFAVLEAAPRETAVIVMTAFGDVPTAVEALRGRIAAPGSSSTSGLSGQCPCGPRGARSSAAADPRRAARSSATARRCAS